MDCFMTECLGRVILIAIAVFAAVNVWWAPIVVAPVFWRLWDFFVGRRSRIHEVGLKLSADALTHVIWISYIWYTIAAMAEHGHGWGFGLVIAIVVAQVFGLLWPHRWHLERIEGRL